MALVCTITPKDTLILRCGETEIRISLRRAKGHWRVAIQAPAAFKISTETRPND